MQVYLWVVTIVNVFIVDILANVLLALLAGSVYNCSQINL